MESYVEYGPELRPLHRFMDDLRNFATQGRENPCKRFPCYTIRTHSEREWDEMKQIWRTKFHTATSSEWDMAVGAVRLGPLHDMPMNERTIWMDALDHKTDRIMAVSDVLLMFPARDYEEYLKSETAALRSQVYSLAASATLSLIKLELEPEGHVMGPLYRGDAKALELLQSFREGMTTRHFMRRYAPRQKVKPMQIQPEPLATSEM